MDMGSTSLSLAVRNTSAAASTSGTCGYGTPPAKVTFSPACAARAARLGRPDDQQVQVRLPGAGDAEGVEERGEVLFGRETAEAQDERRVLRHAVLRADARAGRGAKFARFTGLGRVVTGPSYP